MIPQRKYLINSYTICAQILKLFIRFLSEIVEVVRKVRFCRHDTECKAKNLKADLNINSSK